MSLPPVFSRRGRRAPISAETLRAFLAYEHDTGLFRWAVQRRPRTPVGSLAGYRDAAGFTMITLAGTACAAQDLAWMWCHGQWPARTVQHKNGDRADNRCGNLALLLA